MVKKTHQSYVRPISICRVVKLENPICAGSDFQVQSPHGEQEVASQPVDQAFGEENAFGTTKWN